MVICIDSDGVTVENIIEVEFIDVVVSIDSDGVTVESLDEVGFIDMVVCIGSDGNTIIIVFGFIVEEDSGCGRGFIGGG